MIPFASSVIKCMMSSRKTGDPGGAYPTYSLHSYIEMLSMMAELTEPSSTCPGLFVSVYLDPPFVMSLPVSTQPSSRQDNNGDGHIFHGFP